MMKRVLWLLVSLLALATPVAAQPEVDAYKIFLGPTGSTCIFSQGAASPEGAVTGSVCDLYLQTTTSPSLWVKSTGTNSTTLWLKMVLPGSGAGLTGPQYCVPYLSATDTQSCYTYFTFNGTGALSISSNTGTAISLSRSAADTDAPYLYFYQSRGTTAAKTATVSGDTLGQVQFWGRDSANALAVGATITVASSGTIGAAKVPAGLSIKLTSNASGSLVERFGINNIGAFSVSTSYGTAGALLQSGASTVATAWTTATYPGTATTAGAYLRANGTNWISSTLILPNSITSTYVPYATAANTLGSSAELVYDESAGTFTVNDGNDIKTTIGTLNAYRRSGDATFAAPEISFYRSRGTIASPTATVDTSQIGDFYFRAYDGNSYDISASFGAIIDGTVSDGVTPSALTFSTESTAGSWREVMRVNPAGKLGIGTGATVSAFVHALGTTEQLRLGYSATEYLSVTASSVAGVTFNATGTTPSFTFSDGVTFSGAVTHSVAVTDAGATLRTGVISPTQITAATDNWNPTGLATANVIRINVDAARNITGIAAQTSGTMLLLYNTTAFVITLKHDATSTAANRFYAPGAIDFPLAARGSVWIRYDGTHSRWSIIS